MQTHIDIYSYDHQNDLTCLTWDFDDQGVWKGEKIKHDSVEGINQTIVSFLSICTFHLLHRKINRINRKPFVSESRMYSDKRSPVGLRVTTANQKFASMEWCDSTNTIRSIQQKQKRTFSIYIYNYIRAVIYLLYFSLWRTMRRYEYAWHLL